MRLTRELPFGSRTIVPSYPMLAISLGILFLLQPPARTSTPGFDAAKQVMPIRAWGVVFLALGLVKLCALLGGRRRVLITCLTIGAGLAGFWAILILFSAFDSPVVSFTAVVWIGHSIWAHIASARSLANDQVSP